MNGKNDLLDDILPMVISGILDPKYITGEDPPNEKSNKEKDNDSEREDRDGWKIIPSELLSHENRSNPPLRPFAGRLW